MLTLSVPRSDDPLAGVTVPVSAGPGPSAGLASHLQRIQAELVSRKFPAGVAPAPDAAQPAAAPLAGAVYASYIRAHS
ncbi:MAG TPA: hypothetical protein VG253_21525 [Streptosporangiaceae bacterium]|nr:hypothetical protein [Streptosporangiaceae bacterium]